MVNHELGFFHPVEQEAQHTGSLMAVDTRKHTQ